VGDNAIKPLHKKYEIISGIHFVIYINSNQTLFSLPTHLL